MHAVSSHSNEQILVLNVPKHVISLSLEVRDHDQALVHWVKHISVASAVNADALCSSLVGEHLLERVLTLVLQDEGLIINQVIAQFASRVNKEQEGVSKGYVCDGRVTCTEREANIRSTLVLNQMKGDFALRQDCRPDVVHDNLLDGAEVLALA